MEFQYPPDMNTRAGTVGGLTLVLFMKLDMAMLMETVILAGIGAVVSFSVSVFIEVDDPDGEKPDPESVRKRDCPRGGWSLFCLGDRG